MKYFKDIMMIKLTIYLSIDLLKTTLEFGKHSVSWGTLRRQRTLRHKKRISQVLFHVGSNPQHSAQVKN